MMMLHKIGNNPIIAAVRKSEDLDIALRSPVKNVFFMGGTIMETVSAIRLAKEHGKGTFVHLDLIRGLSSTDRESVEWIAGHAGADGIVTPKGHLIKEAKRVGLYGILHLFMIDSAALENGLKLAQQLQPDGIELMPGIALKTIAAFAERLDKTPVIASGLIQTREEVAAALAAGATSLSVSSHALWQLTFAALHD